MLEPLWLGNDIPHRVRCAAGHECQPCPHSVQQGQGICRTCARNDPVAAEAAFRRRLTELGATLLESYRNTTTPHRVLCAAGHECYPRPHTVLAGCGACRACAGKDPAAAEAAFRARLAELGATPLYEKWRGRDQGHHVRCAAGHDCWPRPGGVQQGEGVCRKCRGMLWDAFYVVTHEGRARVKFGVTSGDARPRLKAHRIAGYRTVVRLVTGIPGTVAPDTERAIKSALAMAGERPVQGTEYFDASCLALILDVADSSLGQLAVYQP